jgi:tetratricopeptide (TPR) repeat protein
VTLAPPLGCRADLSTLRARLAAHEAGQVDSATATAERLTLRHRLAVLTGGHPRELLAVLGSVDEAVDRWPGWPDLRLLQATLALALHRPGRAARALAPLSALADRPPVLVVRADLAQFSGDYAGAREHCLAALQREPRWDAQARLAALAVAVGDLAEADRRFDAAEDEITAKQLRAFAWVRVQRGDLARSLGEFDRAEARYAEAEAAYPGWWYVEQYRAALALECGHADDAVAGYRAVLAETDRPEVREALGTALAAAGRAFEADEYWSSALAEYEASVRRGETHYLHHLAAFWVARDPVTAVGWARRDVAVRRNSGTLSMLAWCLHRAGRTVEAWRTVQEAFSLGAADPLLQQRARAIEGFGG